MPERRPFQYTILQLVPRVERDERINVGVVVFCRQLGFLGARLHLDHARARALFPGCDPGTVEPHLDAIEAVLNGDVSAGALAALPPSERFGWVAARSSTVIQATETHTGLTADPPATLEHLFARLVATTAAT